MAGERIVGLLAVLAVAGCASAGGGLRPIAPGTPCATCGMAIEDARYACEDERRGHYRFFDSIECLVRSDPAPRVWLSDYDGRALHDADSMWVVKADIPSPMGGGYAAFVSRASAEEVAAARGGVVAKLDRFRPDIATGGQRGTP
jgi:nitrous oxide reductase accessory protein NosL